MEIVERMFEIMKTKGIKPVDLAKCLNVNTSVVSTWKTRKSNPPAIYLAQIAELFGITVEFLVTGNEMLQSGPELTADERTLLNMYRHLDLLEKGKILGKMEAILEKDSYYSAPEACEVKSQTKRVG